MAGTIVIVREMEEVAAVVTAARINDKCQVISFFPHCAASAPLPMLPPQVFKLIFLDGMPCHSSGRSHPHPPKMAMLLGYQHSTQTVLEQTATLSPMAPLQLQHVDCFSIHRGEMHWCAMPKKMNIYFTCYH